MAEKTLYVSDLDGTLLNRRDIIPRHALEKLNGFIQKGGLFTYATARSYTSAATVTEGLRLSLPAITYNGAFLVDVQTGKPTKTLSFSSEELCRLKDGFSSFGMFPLVYSFVEGRERVSWKTGIELTNQGVAHYLSSRKGDSRFRRVQDENALYEGNAFYFTCIESREVLQPLWEILKKENRFTVTLQQELYRTEYWLEVMPREATKAQAALALKKQLQCSRLVVFGDGPNDLSLFKVADEAYATQNAVQEVQAAATGILGSCEEGAVAQWLWEQVL